MTDTKRCSKCGETKPTMEFYNNKSSPDGKSAYCAVCVKDGCKKSNQKKQQKAAIQLGRFTLVNSYSDGYSDGYANGYREAMRIVAAAADSYQSGFKTGYKKGYHAAYQKGFISSARGRAIKLANGGRYRGDKRKRTPADANHALIKIVYAYAKDISVLLGDMHVDHIYPLAGDDPRGIHDAHNLQILTSSENASKGARIGEWQSKAVPTIYTRGFAAFLAEQGYMLAEVIELYNKGEK